MDFDYKTPAELFLSKRTGRGRTKYRRFATAAEAIRYAVEDLPALRSLGAWMQVGDERAGPRVCARRRSRRCFIKPDLKIILGASHIPAAVVGAISAA
jgi:hypothetical protein